MSSANCQLDDAVNSLTVEVIFLPVFNMTEFTYLIFNLNFFFTLPALWYTHILLVTIKIHTFLQCLLQQSGSATSWATMTAPRRPRCSPRWTHYSTRGTNWSGKNLPGARTNTHTPASEISLVEDLNPVLKGFKRLRSC